MSSHVTCATCGATAPVDGSGSSSEGPEPSSSAPRILPPTGWTTSLERGRTVVVCPGCTRRHARSIEARLDLEWW